VYSTTPFFSRGPVTAFCVGPVSVMLISSHNGTNRRSRPSTRRARPATRAPRLSPSLGPQTSPSLRATRTPRGSSDLPLLGQRSPQDRAEGAPVVARVPPETQEAPGSLGPRLLDPDCLSTKRRGGGGCGFGVRSRASRQPWNDCQGSSTSWFPRRPRARIYPGVRLARASELRSELRCRVLPGSNPS
jgi:hypothetical protein